MATGIVIVVGLIVAAILYGIFFLFFKLIWILCKKQRNFWPLVLAGVATVLTLAATVYMAVYTAKKFIQPFAPIIETMATRTEPVYGPQPYTDPRYGFSITLYNGTVLSEWIDLGTENYLVGFDTNPFVGLSADRQRDPEQPVTLYLIVRQEGADTDAPAIDLLKDVINTAGQMDFDGEIDFDNPQPAYAGPGATAAKVNGNLYTASSQEGIAFALLMAKQGTVLYYVIGGSNESQDEIYQTVESFRTEALSAVQESVLPAPAPTANTAG